MCRGFQVLCASNEDHTIVDPVAPPLGAAVGERVSFLGYGLKILPPMLEGGFSSLTAHTCGDPRGMHVGVEYMYGASF